MNILYIHPTMKFIILPILFLPLINGDLCDVCKCGVSLYNNDNMYITNCTEVGITPSNISLLENLPVETEVFIFVGNDVPVLPVNIFGTEKNLTKLKVIDMTGNKIEAIKGKTFHHVPVVERLILNHNSITLSKNSHPRVFSNFENLKELHLTDAFLDYNSADLAEQLHIIFINSNLTQLIKLHLEQNEIRSFADKRVFCDLQNLMDLHLGNNALEKLSFDIKCLPKLRYLDLESNNISHFNTEDLNTFDAFSKNRQFIVDIHNNKFNCDCSLDNLHLWLKNTTVVVKNKNLTRCNYLKEPSKFIFLNDFNSSECRSSSVYFQHDVHPYTKYLLFSLLIFLVIYLIFLSIKYTAYCKHNLAPPGKVHYVVITNQDDKKEVRVQLNKIFFNV